MGSKEDVKIKEKDKQERSIGVKKEKGMHERSIEEKEEKDMQEKNMEVKEYLDKVSEEIRCRLARESVREELGAHIEDQKNAFMGQGKSEEEACHLAVLEMGSPEEVGKRMDQLHRPKADFALIAAVLGLAIFGIFLQGLIFPHMDNAYIQNHYLSQTVCYNVLGLLVMLAFYYLDYRLLAKHVWKIYFAFLVFSWALIFFARDMDFAASGKFFFSVDSSYAAYLRAGNLVWVLFLPVLAGFIYRFGVQGWKGYLKTLAVFALTVFLEVDLFQVQIASFWLVLVAAGLVTLFAAVITGNYGFGRKGKILSIAGTAAACGGLGVFAFVSRPGYALARLQVFLGLQTDKYGADYVRGLVRESLAASQLLGSRQVGLLGDMSGSYSEYVITCCVSYFGIFVTMLVLAGILFVLLRSFYLSAKQENKFGFLLGFSLSTFLLFKSIIYLLANFGLLPDTAVDLPFLSFGMTNTFANYAYLGLILAVNRYADVFGAQMPECGRKAGV